MVERWYLLPLENWENVHVLLLFSSEYLLYFLKKRRESTSTAHLPAFNALWEMNEMNKNVMSQIHIKTYIVDELDTGI